MNFARSRARKVGGFNMTPMIDVVFQLIIFFLYTSQFSSLVRTPLDLPEERGDPLSSERPATVVLDITPDGTLLIEREAVDLAGLTSLLRAEIDEAGGDAERVTVLVRADRSLDAAHANRVASALASLGVRGWRLATEAPGGGGL